MIQTDRAIIRDSYGAKYFEIIRLDSGAFFYDYSLRRFLDKEEIETSTGIHNELQTQG